MLFCVSASGLLDLQDDQRLNINIFSVLNKYSSVSQNNKYSPRGQPHRSRSMNAFRYDAQQIKEQARLIRRNVITLNAASPAGGHTGADLSETDILATLYFRILDTGPERIEDPERDIYIQSKGHGVGGLYCCLAQAGYIPEAWLADYQHFNSRLPGHPVRQKTPGIELNTGALGHGLPVAVGLALAARMSG
ncbi:Transketolase, partial [Pseudomonas cannabina pv. alisalensis]